MSLYFTDLNEAHFHTGADRDRCDLIVLSPLHASSYGPFTLQDFQTRAAFELIVSDSKPLTPGTSKIATQSAYVMLAHGLVPGNSDGLEIQFFPQPITES